MLRVQVRLPVPPTLEQPLQLEKAPPFGALEGAVRVAEAEPERPVLE